MTVKIKELREPPLLNLPEESRQQVFITAGDMRAIQKELDERREKQGGWWIADAHRMMARMGHRLSITEKDRKAFAVQMEQYRKERKGRELAQMHIWLKELGLEKGFRTDDREMMLACLGDYRKKEDGRNIAGLHLELRELGLRRDVTAGDLDAMEKQVESDRHPLNRYGYDIAAMYNKMRKLGLPVEVSGLDLRLIRGNIRGFTKDKDGLAMAMMYSDICESGLEQGLPPVDMGFLRQCLDSDRDKGEGGGIMLMHYYLRVITQHETAKNLQPPMPPLKKFDKR
jgi:hypothetical protein